jgi:methionyl-tRNA formyltransferase
MKNKLNIAFVSSSDFTIPILEDIHKSSNQNLKNIFEKQCFWLEKNLDESKIKVENLEMLSFYKKKLSENLELWQKEISLSLIISQPRKQNRQKLSFNPILDWAEKNKILTFTPQKLNQEFEDLENKIKQITNNEGLDLGVTASYGQIISQKILDLPKNGFINWHPSKLPKYRGPTPMQTLLKNGETQTALSWIKMTKEMDAGEILLQLETHLEENINFFELSQKMAEFGKNTWSLALVNNFFDQYQFSQNLDQVSFCQILHKKDKFVNPKVQTAKQIFDHFRAFITFPKTVFVDNKVFLGEIKILECNLNEKFKSEKILKENLDKVLFENDYWIQIQHSKNIKSFLKCRNQTLLQIYKIGLETGKQVNLEGYIMKNK